MESKLQELTTRIYNEGIGKAQADAAEILGKAEKEAASLLSNARQEADAILRQAREEADELRKNVANEVKMSSRQAISALRQQITGLITAQMVAEPVRNAFSDKDFIKKMIETIIAHWDPASSGQGLTLFLPVSDEKSLGSYFESRSKEILKSGLQVVMDEKTGSGFRIGPSDNSFILSFTDSDFEAFFRNYLRPRTTKLLYGGE